MWFKRTNWVLIAALSVLGVLATYRRFALDAGPASLTTDTQSSQLKTSAERVEFLGRYLKLRTPISDAAFRIVWHDNSGFVPGPSDWSMAAAVKVTPADSPTWLAGAKPVTQAADYPLGISQESPQVVPADWHVTSVGDRCARERALLIWHPEGVLEYVAHTN
jgi:hypothetical protein